MSPPPQPEDDFESLVSSLRKRIRKLLAESPDAADTRLQVLYKQYTKRFLSDNNRIWTTGSILLPLSLGPFVALASSDCVSTTQQLVLAGVSVSLVLGWNVFAEKHRAFQTMSFAWLTAIEKEWLLDDSTESAESPLDVKAVSTDQLNRLIAVDGSVQAVRWLLVVGIVIAWVFVLIWWPGCTETAFGSFT